MGRIVHYVSFGTPGGEYSSQCRAAVITEVGASLLPDLEAYASRPISSDAVVVGLCVLNPTGQFFNRGVVQDAGTDRGADPAAAGMCDGLSHHGGTWHWPARTEEDPR